MRRVECNQNNRYVLAAQDYFRADLCAILPCCVCTLKLLAADIRRCGVVAIQMRTTCAREFMYSFMCSTQPTHTHRTRVTHTQN